MGESQAKNYQIVGKPTVLELVEEVNRLMDEGWIPTGGIHSYTRDQYSEFWLQAVMRLGGLVKGEKDGRY